MFESISFFSSISDFYNSSAFDYSSAALSSSIFFAFSFSIYFFFILIMLHWIYCFISILERSAFGSHSSIGSLGFGGLASNSAALASYFFWFLIFYHFI